MSQRIPSSDRFVVRAEGAAATKLREHAMELGALESLRGPDGGLEVLRLNQPPGEAREAWARVCRTLGPESAVAPVLLDESGQVLYATGRITVRFDKPPAEDELSRFASRYSLRLRERNKLAPAQVTFDADATPEVFPPDFVEELGRSPGVRAAWLETLSAYRRL